MESPSSGNTVRNVIFDLGNVLLTYKPMAHFAQLYSDEESLSTIYSIFSSNEWRLLDLGRLTLEEAIVSIKEKFLGARDKILEEAFASLPTLFKPILSSLEALEWLSRSGYGLYILSNFHSALLHEVKKQHKFFDYFHGEVISADVHLVKPDEEIFLLLCNKYNLRPQECLFIDDTRDNIQAAKLLGFKTIHFGDDTKLFDELANHGIYRLQ